MLCQDSIECWCTLFPGSLFLRPCRSLLAAHDDLQASALLALCKMMALDASFCDSNLQLLFTLLQNRWNTYLLSCMHFDNCRLKCFLHFWQARIHDHQRKARLIDCLPLRWNMTGAISSSLAACLSTHNPSSSQQQRDCQRQFSWACLLCRSVPAQVRSNLVIAVGDLAFRYPNVLEPWTHNMYRPLSDPDKGKLSISSWCSAGKPAFSCSNPKQRWQPWTGRCWWTVLQFQQSKLLTQEIGQYQVVTYLLPLPMTSAIPLTEDL